MVSQLRCENGRRQVSSGESDRTDILRRCRVPGNIMQTWEQEVAEFEMKCAKKVDEDAKILALLSNMSETSFNLHTVLRHSCHQLLG